MLVIRVCGDCQNFYMFVVYRNPDPEDHIKSTFIAA